MAPPSTALVTGGASGLGLETSRLLISLGWRVWIADLVPELGQRAAAALGDAATFVLCDVREREQVLVASQAAAAAGSLRAVVHTAGRSGRLRIVDDDGAPGDTQFFSDIIATNLIGSYNVLSAAGSVMARNDPLEGDRGVVVLTASVAAYEGQAGAAAYASSKAGVIGMTLVAARELALHAIRVCTIAPGMMDTPMLAKLSDEVRADMVDAAAHPRRLGYPTEFASLAHEIISNHYLNGETIRLDAGIRMGRT